LNWLRQQTATIERGSLSAQSREAIQVCDNLEFRLVIERW
jgi:hypothetical protein